MDLQDLQEKDFWLEPEGAIESIVPIDHNSLVPESVQKYGAYIVNEHCGVSKLCKAEGKFFLEPVFEVPIWVSDSWIDIENKDIRIEISAIAGGQIDRNWISFNDIKKIFGKHYDEVEYNSIRRYLAYSIIKQLGFQKLGGK